MFYVCGLGHVVGWIWRHCWLNWDDLLYSNKPFGPNVSLMDSTTLQTADGEILIDFSKNLINQEVLDMLLAMVTLAHTHTQPHTGEAEAV